MCLVFCKDVEMYAHFPLFLCSISVFGSLGVLPALFVAIVTLISSHDY